MSNPYRMITQLPLGLAAALAVFSPGLGSALGAQSTPVVVRDAWVREAPAGRKVTAAFMVLENQGTAMRSIVRGSSDAAETVELHEMKRTETTMAMSPVPAIAIPAGGRTALKPGGLHVMLFGLRKPLAGGDTVQLTLVLDNGSTLRIAAPVRRMEGMR